MQQLSAGSVPKGITKTKKRIGAARFAGECEATVCLNLQVAIKVAEHYSKKRGFRVKGPTEQGVIVVTWSGCNFKQAGHGDFCKCQACVRAVFAAK